MANKRSKKRDLTSPGVIKFQRGVAVKNAREVSLELKNVMEDVVASYVDEVLGRDENFCGCPCCRLDVIALTLNRLKPKYVVSPKGYVYAKISELQAQFQADTIVAATKAMKAVKKNPRH
jgi:competence protein ComFB